MRPQQLTGHTLGRFVVGELLGTGGMGEVYRAEDTRLKRSVAIKRLDPAIGADQEYRDRFLKEAERAARLTHQGVAGLHDVLDEDGELYLVMEYIEGRRLDEAAPLPLRAPDFLDIAVQCAEALQAAHEQRIVHRDIKPANIMLTAGGQVKILDFGVARRLPDSLANTSTSTEELLSDTVAGTPAFMAPEVMMGRAADPRSDLFSLGIVFYELLTGRHPFVGETFTHTADRILHEEPRAIGQLNPRVPQQLERIVEKLLAKDPDERYATAADLLVDLRSQRRSIAGRTTRTEAARTRRSGSRRRLAVGLGVAAAVMAIVTLAVPALRDPLLRRAGLTRLPASPHLIVLPFTAYGSTTDDQAFARGFSAVLAERLARLSSITTLSVTPMPDLIGAGVDDVADAAVTLGADLGIGGRIELDPDRAVVHLEIDDERGTLRRLVAAAPRHDPYALEDAAVVTLARLFDVDPAEALRSSRTPGTGRSPAAHIAYLRGIGYLYWADGPPQIELAIDAFQQATVTDPSYALAHTGLGTAKRRLYRATGNEAARQSAMEDCQRALSLAAALAAGHECLGRIAFGDRRYEEAADELAKAWQYEPTNDGVLITLADALVRLGRVDEAERLYLEAIEQRPHDWLLHTSLGVLYATQGRMEDAVPVFEHVVVLAPRLASAHSNLGAAYASMQRWERAADAFEASTRLQGTAEAYNNLATFYFERGNFQEAIRNFQIATTRPASAWVSRAAIWGGLGDAFYWAPGLRADAAAAYRRAVEHGSQELEERPDDALLLARMATWWAALGERATALHYAARAGEVPTQNFHVYLKLARALEHLDEIGAAKQFAERALATGATPESFTGSPEFSELLEHEEVASIIR